MAESAYSDQGQNPQGVTPWVATSSKTFVRAKYLDDGTAVVSSASVQPDTLTTKVVDVTTTAAVILAALATRSSAVLQNVGSVDCYIGPSSLVAGVVAADPGGFLIAAGGTFSITGMEAQLAYYARTSSSTTQLAIMEAKDA